MLDDMLLINYPRNAGMFCSGHGGDARAVSMLSVDLSTVDVEAVKAEWTLLWQGRIDDKVRAQALCVFVLTFDLGWIWV
jgi:hypothetical protein